MQFPNPIIMSDTEFRNAYKNIEFENIRLKFIDIKNDHLKAIGYVRVKANKSLLNFVIGGERKFELIAKKGRYGWKIVAFALNI